MTEYVSTEEFNKLLSDFKKVQKQLKKCMKMVKLTTEDENKPKRLNGFAKPTSISESLANFLGMKPDEQIARTEVTKRINKYVKDKELQKQENKRIITVDKVLGELLNKPDDVELTFFNLQKYIKHHYVLNKKVEEEENKVEEEENKVEEEENKVEQEEKKVKKVKKFKK